MTHLRAQVAVDAAPHCGQRSSRTGRDKEDAAAALRKHCRRVFRIPARSRKVGALAFTEPFHEDAPCDKVRSFAWVSLEPHSKLPNV